MIRSALLIATGLAFATMVSGQAGRDLVPDFVRSMGFLDVDVSALNGGNPVAKALSSTDPQAAALFGAIRIEAPADLYIQNFRNIEKFERGDAVSQIGKFHDPPQIDDVKLMTLEATELRLLPNCRPGSCDLQLSADMMNRLRSNADQANASMRGMMLDLLNAYRKTGNTALGVYDDQPATTRVAIDFQLLLDTLRMPASFPELIRYLRDYPRAPLSGAEDFFYWSKVEFGLKPTIRLNHVTIYPLANRSDGIRYVIATKQLYATHYFSSTLELRFLIDDRSRPGKGFYLLDYSTSRVPGFAGFSGVVLKPMIQSQARASMEKYLASVQRLIGR